MRIYMRHPTDIPIELRPVAANGPQRGPLRDVGLGGLCCRSEHELDDGCGVTIHIDCVKPPFKINGRVRWCRPHDGGFRVGIEFDADDDALFRLRMVEQVCQIEHYRREVATSEGRELSSEQAAYEWIDRFGSSFPALA